jgi:predicted permease
MAVRRAIGAGRGRLLRQLVTENLLLALAGGVLGFGLARLGIVALMALRPESMYSLETVRVDPAMLWFALGISVVTGGVFGLAPAIQGSRPDVLDQIRDASRSGTPSSGKVWARNTFVVAEVALSIVLLVGAGLLINSLGRLLSTDAGFDPHNVLALSLELPEDRYPEAASRTEFHEQLEERILMAAGDRIESLGTASNPPPRMGIWHSVFAPEGGETAPPFDGVFTWVLEASPGYLQAMGIELVDGRDFVAGDEESESNPIIVNADWARQMWGDVRAAGRRFVSRADTDEPRVHTVVGVIADAKLSGPMGRHTSFNIIWPRDPGEAALSIAVRAAEDPMALVDVLKEQVWAIDPNVPIEDVALIEQLLAGTLAPQRFNAVLMTLAAVVAVALALIGLYGVLSYSVGQRTREIGIRMALGAETSRLVPMVAWQGMRLVVVGVVIGVGAAVALTRFIESLLYEVTAFDAITYATVVATLAIVSTLACLAPAARAARLDPMVALRSE